VSINFIFSKHNKKNYCNQHKMEKFLNSSHQTNNLLNFLQQYQYFIFSIFFVSQGKFKLLFLFQFAFFYLNNNGINIKENLYFSRSSCRKIGNFYSIHLTTNELCIRIFIFLVLMNIA
jgi:hypothetical protein